MIICKLTEPVSRWNPSGRMWFYFVTFALCCCIELHLEESGLLQHHNIEYILFMFCMCVFNTHIQNVRAM